MKANYTNKIKKVLINNKQDEQAKHTAAGGNDAKQKSDAVRGKSDRPKRG